MQRAARFSLWGGLAAMMLSFALIGWSALVIAGSLFGALLRDDIPPTLVLGILTGMLGFAMLFAGCILKAISPESREET